MALLKCCQCESIKGGDSASKLQFNIIQESIRDGYYYSGGCVGMDRAHVRVYDSLLGTLPADAKKQIASLLMTEEKKITIEYANNQVSKYIIYKTWNLILIFF